MQAADSDYVRYSECGKIIRYTIAELAAISEQQCAAEPRAVAESERQRLTYTFTQPCKACGKTAGRLSAVDTERIG